MFGRRMHDADEMSSSSLQHAAGSGWIKLARQFPRKELSRVVVDHCMRVQARSVDGVVCSSLFSGSRQLPEARDHGDPGSAAGHANFL